MLDYSTEIKPLLRKRLRKIDR